MAILEIDGRKHTVPDEQVKEDAQVRDIAVLVNNAYASAKIVREVREGVTYIRAVKEAGSKGVEVLDATSEKAVKICEAKAKIERAETQLNPALLVAWQLKLAEQRGQLDVPRLIGLQAIIEQAIEQGEQEGQHLERTVEALSQATPSQPSVQLLKLLGEVSFNAAIL